LILKIEEGMHFLESGKRFESGDKAWIYYLNPAKLGIR
jgi:hypothetical protein